MNRRSGRRRRIPAVTVLLVTLLASSLQARAGSGRNRENASGSDRAVASPVNHDVSHSDNGKAKGFFTVYPDFAPGRAKWRKKGRSSVKLVIPVVRNLSLTRTTGTLRVYLIAGRSRAVYRGKGRTVAFRTYSTVLPPNFFFPRVVARVRLRSQPRGWVRTAMVLGEFNGFNYSARDVIPFPGRVRFRR